MRESMDENLLHRYLNDQCTASERAQVEQWMIDPLRHEQVKAFMEAHWQATQQENVPMMLGGTLKKVHDHIKPAVEEPVAMAGRPFVSRYTLIGVAASLALICAVVSVWMLRSPSAPLLADASAWETITTSAPSNERTHSLTLQDGTKVFLNAKSTIRFPKEFSNEKREVFLEGEAYFDVTEDESRPFIVNTSDIQVKVLGTAFTVKSYQEDATSETTLLRGKVMVHAKENSDVPVVLKPNERMLYTRNEHKLRVATVSASDYMLWKEGTILFDDEPIENVVHTLDRWYNVRIHMPADVDMNCRLTARIENESLAEMLSLLQSVTNITYTQKGNDIFIHGSICNY